MNKIYTWFRTFIHLTLIAMPTLVIADAVSETNYSHIDPQNAIVANGNYLASSFRWSVRKLDGVKIGAALKIGPNNQLQLATRSQEQASLAFLFDEDICVFGASIKIDGPGASNTVKVVFSFIARDGAQVDQKMRWPAKGTTLQSFTSDNFASRFAGVVVSSTPTSRLTIGNVRALPCALAVS